MPNSEMILRSVDMTTEQIQEELAAIKKLIDAKLDACLFQNRVSELVEQLEKDSIEEVAKGSYRRREGGVTDVLPFKCMARSEELSTGESPPEIYARENLGFFIHRIPLDNNTRLGLLKEIQVELSAYLGYHDDEQVVRDCIKDAVLCFLSQMEHDFSLVILPYFDVYVEVGEKVEIFMNPKGEYE